jgi:3-oxoacyl-[acyl-carrier protein] reductase
LVVSRLKGKVAIVTGAAAGIGRAIAQRFALEGARVAVLDRRLVEAERVVADIRAAGGEAMALLCDVSVTERISAAVEAVVAAYGTVDILVNNAFDRRTIHGSVLKSTPLMIADQLNSSFVATLAFMQACYPYLERAGGRIINFGSAAGVLSSPGVLPYAVGKEAIRTLTRLAAREWGEKNIRVNAICPIALTDATREALDEENPGALPQMSLCRMGSPETDIAPVALFLASDDSAYMTGYTLSPDGGFLIDAAR